MAILDLIEFFDNTGELMVARMPKADGSDEIRLGSQLVVQQTQTAIFYRDGQVLDRFGPGRHTLATMNLPLLGSLIGAPFGGKSPFRSYVYYVANKTFTKLGWGTSAPVTFRDSEFRFVSLRAHGAYSIRIVDPTLFLQNIVGTKGLEYTFGIQEFLRSIIISRLNEVLGQVMRSVLDLAAQYSAISQGVKQAVKVDFEQYGIELVDLLVEAITVPPDVQEMINRATGVAARDADKYRAIAMSDALRDAAKNPSGGSAEGLGLGLGIGMARQMLEVPPAPPSMPQATSAGKQTMDEVREKLQSLKALKEDGFITDSDFEEQKRRLLAGI